ncbi:MAG: Uma2 family endonuclease [Planctomycetes bacterium]|nr:Uma2 family endonuclease [Planctomycetota bacterium]
MANVTIPETEQRELTLAELTDLFGPMPAHRIRNTPSPGTATVRDFLDVQEKEDRLYELIDGVLVEKTMGYFESRLASVLIYLMESFLQDNNLGFVVGESAATQLLPEQVRIPDVAFVSWDRLPERKVPREPLPSVVPDLAVEVLSKSNTKQEMDRKLQDYFQSGVRLVWYLDPPTQTAQVYTSPEEYKSVDKNGTLEGGDVLPGFSLSMQDWFARADRAGQ